MNQWYGNKKAITILRVSSYGQKDNTSRITQERDIKDYCKRHHLELTETIPIVETARKSELRKKYSEVFNGALKSGTTHFIFHKYDREARNLTDNERNENLVREGKIILHYVADQKVLHKDSPDSDFLIRDYHAVQNKHYSRDLSTKVKAATKTKAEHGWFPGTHPPLGYVHQSTKDENGREFRRRKIIVKNPDDRIVRQVAREFELRAQMPTPSLIEIRRRIIREGLVPPGEAKKYHAGTIERRLKNTFYNGRFTWNDIEYRGKHELFISDDTFWKVQETFGFKNPYRAKSTESLFGGGWLKCAEEACGCNVVYDPVTKTIKETREKKTFKYYHCTNGKRVHVSLKGMRVSEEDFMNQFLKAVSEISIREDFKNELLAALNAAKVKSRKAIERNIQDYSDALKGLEGKEDRVYQDFVDGVLDKEGYQRQIRIVRENRDHFTQLLKKAELAVNDVAYETCESILQLATNAESLWKRRLPHERRMFLERLLSNQALDGVNVRYELIKPLRTLSEMKSDQKWRRGKFLSARSLTPGNHSNSAQPNFEL